MKKNKLIEQQLKKVSIADLSNYDENTNTYYIPKINQIRLEVDKCYIVKLNKILLIKPGLDLLVVNWNHNTVPPCEYLKIDVSNILNKMIKVNAIGYDNNTNTDLNIYWSGWLPLDEIEVIQKL